MNTNMWGHRLIPKLHLWLWLLILVVVMDLSSGFQRDTPLKRLYDSCFVNASKCCFNEMEVSWFQKSPRCEFDELTQSFPCSIKLGVNDWKNSFANVYVAKIFLEEFLGYPVEIKADYEDFTQFGAAAAGVITVEEMWEALATGEIDAILEVWRSGKEESIEAYIAEEEKIVDAGQLGILGTIGWYMPSFLIQNQSFAALNSFECNRAEFLEYWRSLQSPEVSAIFEDRASSKPCCPTNLYEDDRQEFPCIASELQGGTPIEKGGFLNSSECTKGDMYPTYAGRFLSGAPEWISYDDQIIKNLNLNFTIQFAGFESEILRQVTLATQKEVPILFYYWEPNALFSRYNLTKVLLPRHTSSCWEKRNVGGVACDYASEVLFKMYRKPIEKQYPDVAKFFEILQFRSNQDQQDILFDVSYAGLDYITASCKWAKQNALTWTGWLELLQTVFNDTEWETSPPKNRTLACECINGKRDLVNTLKGKLLVSVKVVEDHTPCSETGFSIYETRWTKFVQKSIAVASIPCQYIPITPKRGVAIMITSGATFVLLVVYLCLLTIYRENAFIRASNYVILATFLVGSISLNLHPFFLLGNPTTATCVMRIASLVYGFLWFQGSLLVKKYVLYKIFAPFKHTSNKNIKQLYLQPIYLFILGSLVLLLWGLIVTFEPVPVDLGEWDNVEVLHGQINKCPDNAVFTGCLILFVIVSIFLSAYMSYQTRWINGAFSEAKFDAITSYTLVVFGLIAFVMTQNTSNIDAQEQALYMSIAISWVVVLSASLVVGTRLYAAISKLEFNTHEILKNSTKPRRLSPHESQEVTQRSRLNRSGSSAGWISGTREGMRKDTNKIGASQRKESFFSSRKGQTPSTIPEVQISSDEKKRDDHNLGKCIQNYGSPYKELQRIRSINVLGAFVS